ncbi:unnamed protein product [Allacma fusca]|uniref:Uncharacterized protein n=1 Tax=Allacma fusca TaxID=39272 RepID=A0A8J2JGZ5_9HEXA|nr:unnamed protein product [Allacma fusca]
MKNVSPVGRISSTVSLITSYNFDITSTVQTQGFTKTFLQTKTLSLFIMNDQSISHRAILSKRYLNSDSYKRAIAAKKPVITEATDPSPDPNEEFFTRVKHTFVSFS